MPFFLSQRETTQKEQMDDPACDLKELENTYRQFGTVNTLLARWQRIYKLMIRPYLHRSTPNSLLDIGFGGGDIALNLARWATADGLDLNITAIDPDPRAFNFVQKQVFPANVEFIQSEAAEMDPKTQQFDFVVSNHVLHHLSPPQLTETMELAKRLSKVGVIFNDGRRSDLAYLLFSTLSRPIFRSSFITQDGLISIKRSYTYQELCRAAPAGWKVEKLFPFRLLLTYYHV